MEELDMVRLERCDRKLQQREYDRNMKRFYRRRTKKEHADLVQKVHELERMLKPLLERSRIQKAAYRASRLGVLPWTDIAAGLREDQLLTTAQHKALKAQVQSYKATVHAMKAWVLANAVIPRGAVRLEATTPSWRSVSLLACPRTRLLGKDWITKRMLHNTDRMFRDQGFPPVDQDLLRYDVVVSCDGTTDIDDSTSGGPSVESIWGHQANWPYPEPPSRDTLQAYCTAMCSTLTLNHYRPIPPNTVVEADGHLQLHQMTTDYGEFTNVLTANFQESDNRYVVVAQSILDDEALAAVGAAPRRRLSYWADIFRLPSGQWRRRVLYFASQRCDDGDAPRSLTKEAHRWECELEHVPPPLQRTMLQQHVMNLWPGYIRQQYDAVCASK
ncbi:Aste57867_827 [Aphanomyces stellatus]|uniref:Aste57867_827 protein n=1 Tax=Aphanomyces stellatus TaxID=120398 RepID=A0A485K6V4_9STRA|nr:hypothetical protein As57867_000826 [Aphanomyces stellatus]VFT78051.1 Aste57867_827 [Aphanomyces stellatus]